MFAQRQQLGIPPADRHIGQGLIRHIGQRGGQQRERALNRRERLSGLPHVEQFHCRGSLHVPVTYLSASPERCSYTPLKLGSLGSGTSTSRSKPSCSSLRCWMATA